MRGACAASAVQARYAPHLDGGQALLAVSLLDADVHVILAGVVSLRSIREGVWTTRDNMSIAFFSNCCQPTSP
jgi:hypothetical protein